MGPLQGAIFDFLQGGSVVLVTARESAVSIAGLATLHTDPADACALHLLNVGFILFEYQSFHFFQSCLITHHLFVKCLYGILGTGFENLVATVERCVRGTSLVEVAPVQVGVWGHCRLYVCGSASR